MRSSKLYAICRCRFPCDHIEPLLEKVKAMIEKEKTKYGWEFIFLGANIDAVETAKHFGIDEDHAVDYHSDHIGTALNYEVLGMAVSSVRSGAKLGKKWKKRIEDDYAGR